MATLPDQLYDDYDNYGESFFTVVRFLAENHDRQYTQSEITEQVDVSQSRVSDFTTVLTDDGWINRYENQTTFSWNADNYHPAERVATDAVSGLYRDLWAVVKTHSQTTTGLWALMGLVFFVAATVLLSFYFAIKTGLFGESAVSPVVFFVLGGGLVIAGTIMTAVTPLQAFVNRSLDRLLG